MPDARGLHCPNCGSPADPEAPRCAYCKAQLAKVSCPSCFALIFDGAAFCARCGVARTRVERDPTAARCPSCRSELQRVEIGPTPLMECAACDGVWVDAAAFERICANSEARAAVIHRLHERPQPAARARVRYRPCPRCGKMMNRVNFGRMSGTVVDVCRGHGTWLDAGELHQIATFIQDGGLERARERQMEDLKEQERRLRDAEHRAAHDRGAADPHEALGIHRGGWSSVALLELIASIRGDR